MFTAATGLSGGTAARSTAKSPPRPRPAGPRRTKPTKNVEAGPPAGPRADRSRPDRNRKDRSQKEQTERAGRRPKRTARPPRDKRPSASKPSRLHLPHLGRGRAAADGTGPVRSTKGLATRTGQATRSMVAGAPANARANRHRVPVAVAALFAVVVLAIGFPWSALLSQHHQLSAAAAQLDQLRQQNRSLTEQQHELNSKTAIERLARQDYQLVSPGQTLYDVLPAGNQTATTAAGSSSMGDPGANALVSPSDAPDMSPQTGLPHTITGGTGSASPTGSGTAGSNSPAAGTSGASAPAAGASSFWSRVANSLEFWK
jgi:cell division protein FtsB